MLRKVSIPTWKRRIISTNSLLVEGKYKGGEALEPNNDTATPEASGTDTHGSSNRKFPGTQIINSFVENQEIPFDAETNRSLNQANIQSEHDSEKRLPETESEQKADELKQESEHFSDSSKV